MTQIINQVVQFLQQGVAAIFRFLQLVWTWSFGQIIAVFQSNWQALPVWKIIVLVVVLAAVAYLLYKAAVQIWEAAVAVFRAFVTLLSAFVLVLPYILIAGLVSFAGGWLIHTVNL